MWTIDRGNAPELTVEPLSHSEFVRFCRPTAGMTGVLPIRPSWFQVWLCPVPTMADGHRA